MNKTVKKISFTALFAAMVFGLTMLHIPIGAGGYIHVGDAMIYLSGLLLGPWAFLAASIGAAFSDLASGVAPYAIPSAIIKFLIAIPFVALYNKSNKLLTVWTALCTILSGAITVGGYYVADLVLYREGAIADIPANAIQAVGSGVYCTGAGAGQGRNLQKIEGLSQWLILFIAITTVCI